jgi:hypothetical protein
MQNNSLYLVLDPGGHAPLHSMGHVAQSYLRWNWSSLFLLMTVPSQPLAVGP